MADVSIRGPEEASSNCAIGKWVGTYRRLARQEVEHSDALFMHGTVQPDGGGGADEDSRPAGRASHSLCGFLTDVPAVSRSVPSGEGSELRGLPVGFSIDAP